MIGRWRTPPPRRSIAPRSHDRCPWTYVGNVNPPSHAVNNQFIGIKPDVFQSVAQLA
jgi:hypothetical protein